ncbi:cyclin Ccl1p [Monosporozyma servazzii]
MSTIIEDTNNNITNEKSNSETKKQEKKIKKRITDDDLYRHSSQYRFWSFTEDSLKEKRIEINENATVKVKELLANFIESKKDTLSERELQAIQSKATPLTYEEELKLVGFYAKKVQVIAQHLNLPTEVVATSITFFKRFYLENSVMEYDPKDMVHTTIFLACKSENYFISVESFSNKAKSKKEEILKYEFKLLESLKFTLLNHHPYKPLHGFFLDIQHVLHGKVDLNYMGKIYDKSKRRITDALLTDAVYHFTPPQITLAVFLIEDEQLIRKYLELKFSVPAAEPTTTAIPEPSKEPSDSNKTDASADEKKVEPENRNKINVEKLLDIITRCKMMIESFETISTQDAKLIYAKNYYCKNPNVIVQKLKRKLEEPSADNGSDEHIDKKQST